MGLIEHGPVKGLPAISSGSGVTSIADILRTVPGPDQEARALVTQRACEVLRPQCAFARLDETAAWLAAWQRTARPSVSNPSLLVFAGDHGVVSEGVSAYPPEVTASMLRAMRQGVATANVLAAEVGASMRVIDTGVGRPTGNIALEPAMTHDRFTTSFEQGREAVRDLDTDTDLLVAGEMGIGNTTAAAAVVASLFGLTPADCTGRGTGIDDVTLDRKVEVVRRARERAGSCDPIETLRQLGGSEMVAIAGAVLEARLESLPVVLDGFVVTASVTALDVCRPGALDHCVAGHRSPEPGHHLLLEKLGKEPLLELDLRLGEGSGALAAIPLIRMAARAILQVTTFQDWGLTD